VFISPLLRTAIIFIELYIYPKVKVGLSSHQPVCVCVCVCVCVPLINLNRLVDLDEILYGGDGIKDDHDYILFNAVASTIPKWPTFKFLRWVQILNRLVDLDKMLYECRESRHISSSQNFLLIIIILNCYKNICDLIRVPMEEQITPG
jgi:hypothetical protein